MGRLPTQLTFVSDANASGVFSIDVDEVPPEDRGRVIAGRYEILERIGEGGMGQVLRVRHRRLGKSFALKLMHAELVLDDEARALFDNEARLASALCHPNIVSVIDFGDDPDWGLFITMELLDGEPLADRLATHGRLPVDIACYVTAQVADALAHSHERGVIHGDVKVENVLCLTNDETDWHAKLLDFGTAQIASRAHRVEDEICGTPAYLAPERITGQPPHASNDIYSCGVLMYELLTGAPPFRDPNPVSVLHMHMNEEPEPVDAARGEVLDEALVAIVRRALQKSPSDRFESAAEMASALSDYMDTIGMRERALAQRVGIVEIPREESAADAFDALGIAAVGLDVSGTIRVANAVFARLMGAAGTTAIEGRNILETAIGTLHKDIRDDVRQVAMTGKVVRRRVLIQHPGSKDTLLRFIMTPANGRCGSCMLAIYQLPLE